MLAIEQQRAAAEAEREQRIRESAELAQREVELTALKAEALAQAEQIAAQAWNCGINWRRSRRT